jgi:membrane-associated protein
LTAVGVLIGGIPLIAHNIDALMIVIILVSILPIVVGALRRRHVARKHRDTSAPSPAPAERTAREQ